MKQEYISTDNLPIAKFALELATAYHKGQKRRDGQDYITHPMSVATLVETQIKFNFDMWGEQVREDYYIPYILADFHDAPEDCGVTEEEIANEFVKAGFWTGKEDKQWIFFVHGLKKLNKNNYKSYKEYILALTANFYMEDAYAHQVKVADLTHNLSDLKPGSLRDKYELSLYILTR